MKRITIIGAILLALFIQGFTYEHMNSQTMEMQAKFNRAQQDIDRLSGANKLAKSENLALAEQLNAQTLKVASLEDQLQLLTSGSIAPSDGNISSNTAYTNGQTGVKLTVNESGDIASSNNSSRGSLAGNTNKDVIANGLDPGLNRSPHRHVPKRGTMPKTSAPNEIDNTPMLFASTEKSIGTSTYPDEGNASDIGSTPVINEDKTAETPKNDKSVESTDAYGSMPGVRFSKNSWKTLNKEAAKKEKLRFVFVGDHHCAKSRQMDSVFKDPKTAAFFADHFVCSKLNPKSLKEYYRATNLGVTEVPTFLFLNKKGKVVHSASGFLNPNKLIEEAEIAISKVDNGTTVAKK